MKNFILTVVVILLSVLQLKASPSNWSFGYVETLGVTHLSGFDDLNTLLTTSDLVEFDTDYNTSSTYGVFLENNKWTFSYSRYALNGPSTSLNYYKSDVKGSGNLIKIGYNFLQQSKADLFLNVGGGTVNVIGAIKSDNSPKIKDVDLLSYGNNELKIEQNNALYLAELMFLYPVFNDILNCADLVLGFNCSYQLSDERNAYLNGASIDLGDVDFSGINAGVTLKLEFDFKK